MQLQIALFNMRYVKEAQWLERLTGDQKVVGSGAQKHFFWVCDKARVYSKQFAIKLQSCKST